MPDVSDRSPTPTLRNDATPNVIHLRVMAVHALLIGFWLLCSGWWLHHLIQDAAALQTRVEALTGWSIMSITALLLGVGVTRNIREIRRSTQQLIAKEERWKNALEGASQAAWDWNAETNDVVFTKSWKAMLGYPPEEVGSSLMEWKSRIHPDDLPRVMNELQRHLDGRTPSYSSEHRLRCKDGSYKWILDQGKVMSRAPDGRPLRALGTHSDISERKRMEGEVRQWADAFRYCAHGINMTMAESNRILVCNPALAGMLGRPVETMAGLGVLELYVAEDRDHVRACLEHSDRVGHARYEARQIRQDDTTFPVQVDVVSVRDAQGTLTYRVSTVQDISARRQSERLQLLATDVLRILNDPEALPDATQRILDAIKRDTGIEAVAIRLSKDGHFPFVAADGFPAEFLQAENDLRVHSCNGQPHVDDQGHVRLECTCGLVLAGKRGASSSWMTPDGSAWTNDARPMLDLPGDQDPRFHPRNRCIHEGFQSVALIPIRAHDGVIGLLQLNDRRKGCFTLEMICYLEGLATSFGVALLRLQEEQALRKAEQKFRGIFENAVEGIYQAAPDGRLISANPAMARILGFDSAEALIASAETVVPPPMLDPERDQAFTRELAKHGAVRDFESQRRRADGSLIWVSSDVWVVPDASGTVDRYEGTLTDITSRKQAETVLHERLELQDQLAKVALTVPGMIFSFRLDANGTASLPFCTSAIEELWGLRADEVKKDFTPGLARIHPEDRERVQSRITESARTNSHWHDVFRVRHPAKGEVWLAGQSLPRREPDGSILWQGFVQDVTESKVVEETLRRSEERYRNLVETTSDWVWEVDQNGRYTYASHKVQELLGYRPDEVIGKRPLDLMPEDEARRLWAHFAELIRSRKAFTSVRNVNRHKDGRLVTLESSGAPMVDPDGQLKGYRGMDRDVSERIRLEQQFRQAQKLEAIGQLAGGVAHDFNNILAATMMHLGLLQMNPDLDDATREALKDLEVENRRAAALTRQLLMFSRRSVMTVQPVDLSSVIANLLKMLTRLIGESISLRFDCPGDLPTLEADPGMLEQVVLNLVVNARDAMPKGGRITIGTRVVEIKANGKPIPPGHHPGSCVCLSVADTGHGIDDETVPHIFEPFFTTKEPGKGTGLGLATVHGIVAQHNGWIEVESQVGQGSTFHVFLPIPENRPRPVPTARVGNHPARGHETILVVEDDLMLRNMVRRALRALGYTVLEAANGKEAMALWQEQGAHVDLLLTDMVMPEGVTGLELIEQLQALKPDLKAILSSGYSAEIVQAGVTNRPGVSYLPKPYEIEALSKAVRNQLRSAPSAERCR